MCCNVINSGRVGVEMDGNKAGRELGVRAGVLGGGAWMNTLHVTSSYVTPRSCTVNPLMLWQRRREDALLNCLVSD